MAQELSRYQKIKNWCKEHKKEITVGVCFALIFFVGFGTGRYDKEAQSAKRKAQSNYSKSSNNQQKADADNQNVQDQGQVAGDTAEGFAPAADGKCPVKGNINTKGKRIYHVSTGAFYNQTKPERCFNTEAEARKAGFVKSSR